MSGRTPRPSSIPEGLTKRFVDVAANKRILKRGTIAGKEYLGVLYQGASSPIVVDSNNLTGWTLTGCTAELALGGLTKDASWRGDSNILAPASWSIISGNATTIDTDAAEIEYDGQTDAGRITIGGDAIKGRAYLLEFEVYDYVAGVVTPRHAGGDFILGPNINTNGVCQFIWIAPDTSSAEIRTSAGLTTLKIRNITLNEVEVHTILTATANNATATQATTSASAEHAARFRVEAPSDNTGDVDVSIDNGTTQTTVTKGSFQDITPTAQTIANPTMHIEIATSGDTVKVYDAQVEAVAAGVPAFAWHVPQGDPIAAVGASSETKTRSVAPTEIDVEVLIKTPAGVSAGNNYTFSLHANATFTPGLDLYWSGTNVQAKPWGGSNETVASAALAASTTALVRVICSGSEFSLQVNGGTPVVSAGRLAASGITKLSLGHAWDISRHFKAPIFALRDNNGQVLQEIESYGPELVTNGGFDADTDWNKAAGWAITGGQAVFTNPGSSQNLDQAIALSGEPCEFVVDVASIAGTLRVYFDNAVKFVYDITAPGVYTFYAAQRPTSGDVTLRGLSGANITVNSISVRKVTFKQNTGFGLKALEAFIANGYSA